MLRELHITHEVAEEEQEIADQSTHNDSGNAERSPCRQVPFPRLAQDLCIFMLIEYHGNVGQRIGNACWQLYETFSGSTFFFNCWIAKLFPPIVVFAIVQNRYSKVLFPCIPWW
jgi:hypothetical protein